LTHVLAHALTTCLHFATASNYIHSAKMQTCGYGMC